MKSMLDVMAIVVALLIFSMSTSKAEENKSAVPAPTTILLKKDDVKMLRASDHWLERLEYLEELERKAELSEKREQRDYGIDRNWKARQGGKNDMLASVEEMSINGLRGMISELLIARNNDHSYTGHIRNGVVENPSGKPDLEETDTALDVTPYRRCKAFMKFNMMPAADKIFLRLYVTVNPYKSVDKRKPALVVGREQKNPQEDWTNLLPLVTVPLPEKEGWIEFEITVLRTAEIKKIRFYREGSVTYQIAGWNDPEHAPRIRVEGTTDVKPDMF